MSNELDPRENGTPFYTAPLGRTDAEEQAEADGQGQSVINPGTTAGYNMDEFLQNLRARNEQQVRDNEIEASRPKHSQKVSQEPRQDIYTPINK